MNEKVKDFVRQYALEHLDKSDATPEFDVFVVWQCYILGNAKWLLSTTFFDGMYYEVTYNKAKDEFYFDAYKKFENRCIPNMLGNSENMENCIETKELPNEIANEIQAWMYDMQSERNTGTYFFDAGYLGTITIHVRNSS